VTARHYRYTQIGWTTLLAAGTLAAVAMAASDGGWSLRALGLGGMFIAVAFVLFGTLTITIDTAALHLSVGMVNRRIPLVDIRGWREVQSPVRHGIGARLIPGGMLYCVRPGSAIELLLENGRIVRIGTPEPIRMMKALAEVRTPPVPDYSDVAITVRKPWWPF
jgi:hypothetical protein